jgi:hypothetical protein
MEMKDRTLPRAAITAMKLMPFDVVILTIPWSLKRTTIKVATNLEVSYLVRVSSIRPFSTLTAFPASSFFTSM